jgi:hypothetical protein
MVYTNANSPYIHCYDPKPIMILFELSFSFCLQFPFLVIAQYTVLHQLQIQCRYSQCILFKFIIFSCYTLYQTLLIHPPPTNLSDNSGYIFTTHSPKMFSFISALFSVYYRFGVGIFKVYC